MQLKLSYIVDLALGKPHYLDCMSINLLHTLLHVVLRKTNLDDTQIELTDDTAERVKELLKNLPQEPSICFREFDIKQNGGKIRKKNSREVAAKTSLTKIFKNWPCCRQALKIYSQTSSTSKLELTPQSTARVTTSPVASPKIKEEMSNSEENLEEAQPSINPTDFDVLKKEIQDVKLSIDKIRSDFDSQNKQNLLALAEFNKLKTKFELLTPHFEKLEKISFLQRSPQHFETEVKVCNFSNMGEGDEQAKFLTKELHDIKDVVEKLSDTFRINSECLKKIENEEINGLRKICEKLREDYENIKHESLQRGNTSKMSVNCCPQGDRRSQHSKSPEYSQLSSISTEIKINSARITDCSSSDITEPKSVQSSKFNIADGLPCELPQFGDYQSLPNEFHWDQNFSTDQFQQQQINNDCINFDNLAFSNSQMHYLDDENNPYDETYRENPQNNSLDFIMHQMKEKVNRCDFDALRSQFNEVVQFVSRMQHQNHCVPTAAGGVLPLVRVNCISCKNTTNMTTEIHQRGSQHQTHINPTRNWICYNRNGARRVSGSHTKLVKLRTIRTPVKRVPSIVAYRNHFLNRKICCC